MASEGAGWLDAGDWQTVFCRDDVVAVQAQVKKEGFSLAEYEDGSGTSLLHVAAFLGADGCYEVLVGAGADPQTKTGANLTAQDIRVLKGGVSAPEKAGSGTTRPVAASPLPAPDAVPRPTLPVTVEQISAAFSMAQSMLSSDADPTAQLKVEVQLPAALALLHLQWRPVWAETLRFKGLLALREQLLEGRKRWLKAYFGPLTFNGSLQLLSADAARDSHLTKAVLELSSIDPRQQLSPIMQADARDERLGHPTAEVTLPEFANIVAALVRYEASSCFHSQWTLISSPSLAASLASPLVRTFSGNAFAFHAAAAMVPPTALAPAPKAHPALPPPAERTSSGSSATSAFAETGSGGTAGVEEGGGAPRTRPPLLPHGLVFLGGACGPTTWRKRTAMPALGRAHIPYFNPQVEEWSPELVDVEAAKKAEAGTLLFVISEQTRSIASMIEAAEHITQAARAVVLVVRQIPAASVGDGLSEPGPPGSPAPHTRKRSTEGPPDLNGLTMSEWKDLNRGRTYLRDIAVRHGLRVFDDADEAVDFLVQSYQYPLQSKSPAPAAAVPRQEDSASAVRGPVQG